MPTSLIVVALVVAWLVVLVPMIVRKRQEVARTRTADDRARRQGSCARRGRSSPCEADHDDPDDRLDEHDDDARDEPMDVPEPQRRYRPGRGGYDPHAAALAAKAKYAFRQRIVVAMILAAIASAVVARRRHAAGVVGARRDRHRARELPRLPAQAGPHRGGDPPAQARPHGHATALARPPAARLEDEQATDELETVPRREHGIVTQPAPAVHHGAVVVDLDDEDPAFDELDEPAVLPYRRAVGE